MTYNIILPVLNEELRLENGILGIENFIEQHHKDNYHLTIIDNGSTDSTWDLCCKFKNQYSNIDIYRIETRGVGAAIRAGVKHNQSDIVGYMDIDLSTELNALSKMEHAFEADDSLKIVNASRYNSDSILKGRTKLRNSISYTLVALLKLVFKMKASDAICGFKFFRKSAIEELLSESSQEPGWFLMIEVLLRAERKNMHILELPVVWIYEKHTKVHIFKVTVNYIRQIIRLKKELK